VLSSCGVLSKPLALPQGCEEDDSEENSGPWGAVKGRLTYLDMETVGSPVHTPAAPRAGPTTRALTTADFPRRSRSRCC